MLGVDAAFDRMATMQNRAVKHSLKLFAHRDQDLALYQINVCDHLSDGMFNLDARVHLDEVELAVLVHQKFDGAGVDVADVGERAAEHLADFFAELWRDLRGRGFFEQLLMAALNTALALTQTGNGAVLVGENLEFDVAGMLDVLLHVKVAVAKRSGCFGLRGIKECGKFLFRAHDSHAAATAAGGGLDDHGKTDGAGPLHGFAFAGKHAFGAGKNRNAGFFHGATGLFFLPHQARDFGWRADEFDVAGLADLGKVGVFRKQAVAGMDGIDIGDFGGAYDRRNIEIALRELRRTDADSFVSEANMKRVAICLAVDGHGLDAELFAGADDP